MTKGEVSDLRGQLWRGGAQVLLDARVHGGQFALRAGQRGGDDRAQLASLAASLERHLLNLHRLQQSIHPLHNMSTGLLSDLLEAMI